MGLEAGAWKLEAEARRLSSLLFVWLGHLPVRGQHASTDT